MTLSWSWKQMSVSYSFLKASSSPSQNQQVWKWTIANLRSSPSMWPLTKCRFLQIHLGVKLGASPLPILDCPWEPQSRGSRILHQSWIGLSVVYQPAPSFYPSLGGLKCSNQPSHLSPHMFHVSSSCPKEWLKTLTEPESNAYREKIQNRRKEET